MNKNDTPSQETSGHLITLELLGVIRCKDNKKSAKQKNIRHFFI